MEAMTCTDMFPGSKKSIRMPKLIFFQWKSHRWSTGGVIRELAVLNDQDTFHHTGDRTCESDGIIDMGRW